ncbi:MAG: PQQ-binding-like beta-propeller repeat protein [Planctomycetota bacterium]
MSAAHKLLDRLEQLGLVEDSDLADLRRKATDAKSPLSADTLAKLLIEKGFLTPFQVKKLLADIGDGGGDSKAAGGKPTESKAVESKPAVSKPSLPSMDDDLGLALMDDEPPPAKPASEKAASEKPVSEKPAAAKPSSEKTAAEKSPVGKVAADKAQSERASADKAAAKDAASKDAAAREKEKAKEAMAAARAKAMGGGAARGGAGPSAGQTGPATSAARGAASVPRDSELVPLVSELEPLPSGLEPLGGADPFGGGMGGGLGAADPFAAGAMGPAGPPPGASAAAAANFKKRRRKGWDSPLILLGSGGLVLLLMAFAVLLYIYVRGNAQDILDQANADYQAQSYTQAIARYEKFLANFPKDPNASFVRVRLGLANLRSVVEGTRDLRQALAKSKEIIPTIENEEKFGDARPELAGILPDIALGLAQQAKSLGASAEAKEVVAQADQAVELVRNPAYIPTSLRTSQQQRIDEIERVLGEAKFGIEQEEALIAALRKIGEAAAAGHTGEAFELRKGLLKQFPAVVGDSRLAEAVLRVAGREQQLVKVEAKPTASMADDHPDAGDAKRVLISHRRGETAPGADSHILFFMAGGAVHAFDAPTGQLLWRRTVGYETRIHPIAISKDAGADALLVDGSRQELARVVGKTGLLVWRLAIGERFAPPVVAGGRILVATETGQLWEIDAASGASSRRVQFPQALPVEPGPFTGSGFVYQPGTHSHLYVLAADSLECNGVYYLGHRAGTVVVPPVAALNHLFIAENAGPDYSLIHVLAADAKGSNLQKPAEVEPIRMAGHVVTPLIQVRNRVMAVTNLGEARVIEVDPANEKKPAKVVGSLVKTASQPIPSQALFEYAQLWLGSDRFVGYDVQASRGQINRRWIKHEQEPFVAPLQQIGKTVFHARRRRGSPGISVTAAKMDDGSQIWRTDVAVPIVAVIGEAERRQVTAISGQGDLFRVAKDAFDAGLLDKPVESAEVEGSATTFSFLEAMPLGGGRHLLVSDTERTNLLVYDPNRMGDELVMSKADTGGALATAAPQVFGGAALVPLDSGQVMLADTGTGKARALPFQPRIEPGLKVRWTRPSVYGGDQPEFVIADNRQRIYRAGLKDTPNSHLALLAEAELPGPLVAPIAANSDAAYVVLRTAEGDVVHPMLMPDFAAHPPVSLSGRVMQGPWSIENQVLLVTDTDGLLLFGSDHSIKWKAALPGGPLAGAPRIDGDWVWLATRQGAVLRFALADGKPAGQTTVNAPLYSSPSTYGTRLLIGGSDGAFYALPAFSDEAKP